MLSPFFPPRRHEISPRCAVRDAKDPDTVALQSAGNPVRNSGFSLQHNGTRGDA